MHSKYRMNYCAPSISLEHIEITSELRDIFRKLSNHYTCISGYDYETGSFRAASYDAAIMLISGENIAEKNANLPKILAALRHLWEKVHEPEWQQYFKQKYSVYPNYPVDVRLFCDVPDKYDSDFAYKYCLSVKELEFMIMVFDTYVKHNLYLLPCA